MPNPRTQWRDFRPTIDANVLLPAPADIPDTAIRAALVAATNAKTAADAATNARSTAEATLLDARTRGSASAVASAVTALQTAQTQESSAVGDLRSTYATLQSTMRSNGPGWRSSVIGDASTRTSAIANAATTIETNLSALADLLPVLEMLKAVQSAPTSAPAPAVLADPPASAIELTAAARALREALGTFQARLATL